MDQAEFLDIKGIRVGNAQDMTAATGCTVVIAEEGAVAGVDVRGGSPGTRETDRLNPQNLGQTIHAVLLAGGSAFGLDAAGGVMQYLEEKNIGRDVRVTKVPIVCGAILYDLLCGDHTIRPDKQMGIDACVNAFVSQNCPQGNVGVGTGCTIGKTKGIDFAMKGGLGTACFREGNLLVGAVIAVNCVGDVYDSNEGKIIAGMLNDDKKSIGSSEDMILGGYRKSTDIFSGNTVIGVVATNARLTKAAANKLASMSQDGIARAVRPAHSQYDGDTIFTMATCEIAADPDAVGIMAVMAVESAIINAVKNAEFLHGYLSLKELKAIN